MDWFPNRSPLWDYLFVHHLAQTAREALNMEGFFSMVVENSVPTPLKALDSICVCCQIFSGDKDLNEIFFLNTLGSGGENPTFFTLLLACPTNTLPY